ncbi:MAG: hypothetical protein IPI00_17820 [Flavobacteriales bacterium]|nr:hypothetical protein [Flavobacteriales bacterium]
MPRTLSLCILLLSYFSTNAQWTQRTSPTTQPLYAVQFVNDTGYAVGYYGTVIRSTDRGLSWAAMPFPNSGDLHDVYFHDALNGFAAGDSGLFHTVDGGGSWDAVVTPLQEPWRCITFVSAQVGFCGGGWFGTGALLRTLDGGATWDVVFSGAEIPVSAIQFPSADTGYAVQYSYSWEVLKTTDGGANWSALPIQPMSSLTNLEGLHFLDADNGYAGGWYLRPSSTRWMAASLGVKWFRADPSTCMTWTSRARNTGSQWVRLAPFFTPTTESIGRTRRGSVPLRSITPWTCWMIPPPLWWAAAAKCFVGDPLPRDLR